MVGSTALVLPSSSNPGVGHEGPGVHHDVVDLAGLPGERRPVSAGPVVGPEGVVQGDRGVVQLSLQVPAVQLKYVAILIVSFNVHC